MLVFKAINKKLIFIFFFALFIANFSSIPNSNAQSPGMLEFAGRTTKKNLPLSGAVVTVYRNESIFQEQIKTGKNGKFKFYLVFGYNYKITFSYPGCVDMHLLVQAANVKKEKNDIFPLYNIEIPFFEKTETAVNIEKYKKPFTKIIYDGKKAFMDDENYLENFTKDILLSGEDQAKLIAEREAKEKAEKEKLEAEIKTKNDAAEKVRREIEERLLAQKKAKLEEVEKMIALEKLKEEMTKAKPESGASMESDVIKLQKEKERKELMASKNKEIKTNYQNDILKQVAENEKREKQKSLNRQKQVAETYSVINKMKKETELKAQQSKLNEELKAKKKLEMANQQKKKVEVNNLVKAAAFAEKSVKISNQKTLPKLSTYQKKKTPNVLVYVDEGFFKTTRVTTIVRDKKVDTYKKESYLWSNTYYYRNDVLIDETTYNVEIAYFSAYK